MAEIEKTIFISYRRTNFFHALAVYQYFTRHDYNVFFDFNSIDSGDFEQIALGNVRSRAHFILILTPSALERCNEPGDWLRREIETAIESKRNIVPLMFESFSYDSPAIKRYLTGSLSVLPRYNAQRVPPDFFEEALDRIRHRHLNVPLDAVLHPLTPEAKHAARQQQQQANIAAIVSEEVLTSEGWFEQGFAAQDDEEKIRFYSEAIRLRPDYAAAYNNRGIAHKTLGHLNDAISDYAQAIRLKPDYHEAYYNRGNAKHRNGDIEGAIEDYNYAISLNPDDCTAYNNRGEILFTIGETIAAQQDFMKAFELEPGYNFAIAGLAVTLHRLGQTQQAVKLWKMLIGLDPNYADADWTADNLNWPQVMREEAQQLVGLL